MKGKIIIEVVDLGDSAGIAINMDVHDADSMTAITTVKALAEAFNLNIIDKMILSAVLSGVSKLPMTMTAIPKDSMPGITLKGVNLEEMLKQMKEGK